MKTEEHIDAAGEYEDIGIPGRFSAFSEKELEIRFDQLKKQIVPADKTIREQAEKHWGHVAKPLGSLGVLEEDIVRAAAAQGEEVPDFSKRARFNFCADNGVVEEGVSQTGQEVTAAVVSNMTRGRSCSCLMTEKAETDVFPIDMGIACEDRTIGENFHPLTGNGKSAVELPILQKQQR